MADSQPQNTKQLTTCSRLKQFNDVANFWSHPRRSCRPWVEHTPISAMLISPRVAHTAYCGHTAGVPRAYSGLTAGTLRAYWGILRAYWAKLRAYHGQSHTQGEGHYILLPLIKFVLQFLWISSYSLLSLLNVLVSIIFLQPLWTPVFWVFFILFYPSFAPPLWFF